MWIERAGGPWVDEGIDALCRLAPHTLLNAWRDRGQLQLNAATGASHARARPSATIAAPALLAQLVEHFHGKEGVNGSSPLEGLKRPRKKGLFL